MHLKVQTLYTHITEKTNWGGAESIDQRYECSGRNGGEDTHKITIGKHH